MMNRILLALVAPLTAATLVLTPGLAQAKPEPKHTQAKPAPAKAGAKTPAPAAKAAPAKGGKAVKEAPAKGAKGGKPAKETPAKGHKGAAPAGRHGAADSRHASHGKHGAKGRHEPPARSTPARPAPAAVVAPAPAPAPAVLPPAPVSAPTNAKPARQVASRHYAIDGDTFYYQGDKVRIQGVEAVESELAKQRLQQLLDGGNISVSPVGKDGQGRTVAIVRAGGRDVAEILRAEGLSKAAPAQ